MWFQCPIYYYMASWCRINMIIILVATYLMRTTRYSDVLITQWIIYDGAFDVNYLRKEAPS